MQAKEAQQMRDKVNTWAETQVELSERQKARAVRNCKAREIARCVYVVQ